MQNWDDLRLFLATARGGSSRAAAGALGVNQSTVSRRIRQLEDRSSARLFDRQPGGLVLTEAGEELVELAAAVEEGVAAVDRRLQGRDAYLAGIVRLSLPDFIVAPIAGHLADFSERYPDIDVELMVENHPVDLTRRAADLVLRLSTAPPVDLVGRRVGPVALAVYGAVTYLAERRRPIDPCSLDWVRWDEVWRKVPPEKWIDDNVAPEQIRARINTSHGMAELIAAGVGVGFQPCYNADPDPRFVRVAPPIDFGMVLWVLTHEDLKHTARVRALLTHLGDRLTAERVRFAGHEP